MGELGELGVFGSVVCVNSVISVVSVTFVEAVTGVVAGVVASSEGGGFTAFDFTLLLRGISSLYAIVHFIYYPVVIPK